MLNPYQKSSLKIRVQEDGRLEKAKLVPLESLYDGQLRKTGKVLMGICPAHQESTPSFAIYPGTNTFHCFACGFSGDAITLYMKIKNCDFKTALDALSGGMSE